MSLRTQITGYNTNEYTLYQFVVITGSVSWTVRKRFSNFVQFHAALKRRHPDLRLPRLPTKQWFGTTQEKIIMKRKAELQMYIDELLSHPELQKSEIVLTFLEANTNFTSEIESIQHRLDALQRATTDTHLRVTQRETEVAAQTQLVEMLTRENAELETRIAQVRDEISAEQPRAKQYQKQLEDTLKKLVAATETHAARTAECARAIDVCEKLQIQLASMTAEKEILQNQLYERAQAERASSIQSRSMENDASQHENTLMELRKRSNANLETMRGLRAKYSALQERVLEVDAEVQKVDDMISRVRRRVAAVPPSKDTRESSGAIAAAQFASQRIPMSPEGPRLRGGARLSVVEDSPEATPNMRYASASVAVGGGRRESFAAPSNVGTIHTPAAVRGSFDDSPRMRGAPTLGRARS